MNEPWVSERTVDCTLAKKLIREQMVDIDTEHIVLYGEGWDNYVFRVDKKWIFRFPRRQLAAELMGTELKVVARFAKSLPLPISAPVFEGKPTTDYPWPFAGYVYLPGRPACRAELNLSTRKRMAGGLGGFLAALHSIDIASLKGADIPGDRLGRMDLGKRIPLIRQKLNKLELLELIPSAQTWHFILDELPTTKRSLHLVHGDFYACHFLIDDGFALTGIIDWGDVHLGERACDLMLFYSFLPPEARSDFEANYGELDDETRRLSRLRALDHTANLLGYAFDIGDKALFRESRSAFDRILL